MQALLSKVEDESSFLSQWRHFGDIDSDAVSINMLYIYASNGLGFEGTWHVTVFAR